MKLHHLLLCLLVSSVATIAVAQLPSTTTHNLMLDVINKGAGGRATGSLGTGVGAVANGAYGSTTSKATESQTHTTTLEITISSQDKTATQVQVEWYFFAKQLQNDRVSNESVFDSGNKPVTIQPSGREIFDVASKAVKSSTSRTYVTTTGYDSTTGNNTSSTYASGPDMRNGTKITGWVVRILVDGKVIDAKGSDFKYEDAAKDPQKFENLKNGK